MVTVQFSKGKILELQNLRIEQIFLAYRLPKETVTAFMMLNKKHESNGSYTDGDTGFFDVVAGVL